MEPVTLSLMTSDEVEEVVGVIRVPFPKSRSGKDEFLARVRSVVVAELQNTLREQLVKIEIVQGPNRRRLLRDLKNRVAKDFKRAQIAANTPAGLWATEAFGPVLTQMNLNSFHTSGVLKTISNAFERFRQLIMVSEKQKYRSMTIVPKKRMTFDEILLNFKPTIQEVVLSDLIVDYEVEAPEDLVEETSKDWWYPIFFAVNGPKKGIDPKPEHMIRLTLDANKMYAMKVLAADVAKTIDENLPNSVTCVYSPIVNLADGPDVFYFDMYPDKQVIRSMSEYKETLKFIDDDKLVSVFLRTSVIPTLGKMVIKGIPGVKATQPVSGTVLQIVKDEVKDPKRDNIWLVHLNAARMKTTGIGVDDLVKLFDVCGIKTVDSREDRIDVYMAPDPDTKKDVSPASRARELIRKDEEDDLKYIREHQRFEKYPKRPPTDISLASAVYTIETDGSDLSQLFARDDVDKNHSYSNDPNEIFRMFGIEATRNFLLREFLTLFSSQGIAISPANFVLIADIMTNQGTPVPLNVTGAKRQHAGTMSTATINKALDGLKKGSESGDIETARGTSVSVMMGRRMALGTGGVTVLSKEGDRYHPKIEKMVTDRIAELDRRKNQVSFFNETMDDIDDLLGGIDDPPPQVDKRPSRPPASGAFSDDPGLINAGRLGAADQKEFLSARLASGPVVSSMAASVVRSGGLDPRCPVEEDVEVEVSAAPKRSLFRQPLLPAKKVTIKAKAIEVDGQKVLDEESVEELGTAMKKVQISSKKKG